MRRAAACTLGILLWAGLALATLQISNKPASLRCTLTNKKIEKCCCEKRGEKLYCPLAKKTVDKCCCVAGEAQKDKKTSWPEAKKDLPHMKTSVLLIYSEQVKENCIRRLRAIEGQIRGVQQMIEEQRPCLEVLTQLPAVRFLLHCAPGKNGNSEFCAKS